MKKSLGLAVVPMVLTVLMFSCQGTHNPTTPLDTSFSPTPTPIAQVPGPVAAIVEDKGSAVTGLTVEAFPPSGSVTYTATTSFSGIATFNQPSLETGNWTFVVPAQTPYPFAPSTVTLAVTQSNEQALFNSAGASLQLAPPALCAISGESGGIFTYGVTYTQGSLLVPVTLAFPALPQNWMVGYGPITLGFTPQDSGAITVTGSGCVDEPASFSVSGMDFEPTPYPRVVSAPQTITKNFTSAVTVTWNQPFYNYYDTCNLVTEATGTLTVSSVNSCATVNVWINEPDTNCTSGYFHIPNGNTDAKGGVIVFSPGVYSCSYYSDGGAPVFHAALSSNGISASARVSDGNTTILAVSY